VVLSPSPGRIVADLPIPFAHEAVERSELRDRHDVTDLCAHLRHLITQPTLAEAAS
jgi:hypothetical protein